MFRLSSTGVVHAVHATRHVTEPDSKGETMGVNELPPIMTTAQYAAVMSMSEWTVRKQCRLGIIQGAFKQQGATEWRIRTAEALGVCA